MDVLRLPVVGSFLRWHHSRTVLQVPLLALAALMVWHGLAGPQMGARNLSTILTWTHYRGFLLLGMLVAGNVFCMACPFMLPRKLARRFTAPVRHWPARLRNKWLATGLMVGVFFAYELFDLWDSPWWTAWLIVGYFAAALIVDLVFANATFCKYVCPIGQFNFVASTVSPLELRVTDAAVCTACTTRDCIKGRRDAADPLRVTRNGCELALFQPRKVGSMDCTLCLDCVYACPHDNIGLTTRLPASELWSDQRRSGVGFFSERKDLAALAVIFTFAGLLNAFGMVSPVQAVRGWLGGVLGTTHELPVLGALFTLGLVVEPLVLLAVAALLTRRIVGSSEPLLSVTTRFSYALVPLGLGIWGAHHAFHLLVGVGTALPVAQEALGQLGIGWLLGPPAWGVRGLPPGWVTPVQWGIATLGFVGSLLVAERIAARDHPGAAPAAAAPWYGLSALLWVSALWLLAQPMEMRGMMMMGS